MIKRLTFLLLLVYLQPALAVHTLTLDDAMLIAESNSPTMQRATFIREQSRQMLYAQRAATKARFSLDLRPLQYSNSLNFNQYYASWYQNNSISSYSRFSISQPIVATNTTLSLKNEFSWQHSSTTVGGVATSDKSFFNELYISMEQPLFSYNAQKMTLKHLELDVENAEINFALARLSLEKNVTALYYTTYMAQLKLEIAREELTNTQKSRDVIADKVENGMAAQIELYQADLNLLTASSTVKDRLVELENAGAAMKQYIGMGIDEPIFIAADVTKVDTLSYTLNEVVARGLAARMELRQYEIEVENEQMYLKMVEDYNDFDGSVELAIGLTGNHATFGNIYQKPSNSPSVGISFNIPLYDWGERKARIKAQEASLNRKQIDLDAERTNIVVEIGSIYRNLENFMAQIAIEQQNQLNAELAYGISLEKYRNGDLSSMDLSLYQSQLSGKRISMVQASINYKQALLNLKIATLFDYERQQPVTLKHTY